MRRLGFPLLASLLLAVIVAGVVGSERRVADSKVADPPPLMIKNQDRPVMLVVGDSFTGGSLMNSGPTWPQQIASERDWFSVADAVGGTGYLAGSAQDQSFLDRAPKTVNLYRPDLVILAGGINDLGRASLDDVAAAAASTVTELRDGFPDAEFVMLSNFVSGSAFPEALALRDTLQQVAAEAGVAFVDVTSALDRENVGRDGVHPTDRGHAQLADEIDAAIDALGIPSRIAVPEFVTEG